MTGQPTASALLLSFVAVEAQSGNVGKLPLILGLVGLVPAFLAAIPALMAEIGRRGRQRDAKLALETLKLKCEIEALRRSHQLGLSEMTVSAEELRALSAGGGTAAPGAEGGATAPGAEGKAGWLDPTRLRRSFWYHLVRGQPRLGAAFALVTAWLAASYGGALSLSVLVVMVREWRLAAGPDALILVVVGAFVYAMLWFGLIGPAVRIYRARKLALQETTPST